MRKHHCDPSCRNIKIPQHDNMKGAVLQFFFVRHFHTPDMLNLCRNLVKIFFWTRLFLMQPFTPNTNFTGKICRILFVKMRTSTQHTG